jgi:UDP-N-acetylglucosamine 4,6-dehydratase
MFNNKSILLTGGTGSFGQKFVEMILKKFPKIKKLIIFSRDELKQHNMQIKYPEKRYPQLRFFLGDVRDYERLKHALYGVDYVIHAAALKQVDTAEYNPFEAIKTNILGAENIIRASIDNSVKKVMAISTDKAANPINLYGATKLCSDKLFIAANNFKGKKDVEFSLTRYGNVIGSRGSVLHVFQKLIKSNSNFLTITHPQMTRFWLKIETGVEFVFKNFSRMQGGEIFIPKIPSVKITDVAKSFDKNIKLKIIGMKPGEKIHEILLPRDSSHHSIEFKDHYVIYPEFNFGKKKNFFKNGINEKGKKVKENFDYNSGDNEWTLSIKEINELNKEFLK